MFEFSLPPSALELTAPYLEALLANDSAAALRLVFERGLEAGISAPELQLRLVLPAQREIGRLWQENVISVAQEHLATSISQLVLSRLYPHLPRRAGNGLRVLVACVPGEQHDIGARMGADFLEMAGFEVVFLGANVQTARLLAKISELNPHMLGLSVTLSFHLPALRKVLEAVRTVAPALPVVVGGGVLEAVPGLAEELGVKAFGEDADELAERCRRLFEQQP